MFGAVITKQQVETLCILADSCEPGGWFHIEVDAKEWMAWRLLTAGKTQSLGWHGRWGFSRLQTSDDTIIVYYQVLSGRERHIGYIKEKKP